MASGCFLEKSHPGNSHFTHRVWAGASQERMQDFFFFPTKILFFFCSANEVRRKKRKREGGKSPWTFSRVAAAAPGVFKQEDADALADEWKHERDLQGYFFFSCGKVVYNLLEGAVVFCRGSEGSGHKGMTLEAQNGENNQGGKTRNTKELVPLTDWHTSLVVFNSPFTMETLNMMTFVDFRQELNKSKSFTLWNKFSLKDHVVCSSDSNRFI